MSWEKEGKYLVKEFKFDSFVDAVDFVNEIANLAEKADHHPDILIHDYNNVKVTLYSHEEEKITDKDHSLAKEIDSI